MEGRQRGFCTYADVTIAVWSSSSTARPGRAAGRTPRWPHGAQDLDRAEAQARKRRRRSHLLTGHNSPQSTTRPRASWCGAAANADVVYEAIWSTLRSSRWMPGRVTTSSIGPVAISTPKVPRLGSMRKGARSDGARPGSFGVEEDVNGQGCATVQSEPKGVSWLDDDLTAIQGCQAVLPMVGDDRLRDVAPNLTLDLVFRVVPRAHPWPADNGGGPAKPGLLGTCAEQTSCELHSVGVIARRWMSHDPSVMSATSSPSCLAAPPHAGLRRPRRAASPGAPACQAGSHSSKASGRAAR